MAVTYKGVNLRREKNKYTLSWSLSNTDNVKNVKYKFSIFTMKGEKKVLKTDTVGKNTKSKSYTLSRDNYYPVTNKRRRKVRFAIKWTNSKSDKADGDWENREFKFEKPKDPVIYTPTLNTEGTEYKVQAKVKLEETSTKKRERYQCRYSVLRESCINGKKSSIWVVNKEIYAKKGYDTTEETLTYTETKTGLVNDGDYIKYTFVTWAQGIRGNSGKVTSKPYYIGWAANPTINDVIVNEGDNNVTVLYNPNISDIRPTTSIKLQYCHTTSNVINPDDWADVDGVGEQVEKAKNCTLEALKNGYQKGEKIYVRLLTSNDVDFEGSSAPFLVDYYEPDNESTSTTDVKVTSAIAGTDGESVHAIIGWNNDSYNGTTLSWSTDQDVWRSNSDPDKFEMTDNKWKDETSQASGFANSCSVKIKGLDESTTYYFRARRYDSNDESSYSGWSEGVVACKTGTTPAGVTLTAPPSVAYGKSLTVAWVVGGERAQTAWQVISREEVEEEGETVTKELVIASGNDATTSYIIPADYLADKEQITLQVKAATGGDFYGSNLCSIAIKQAPTITISDTASSDTTGRIITTLPWTFDVKGQEGTQLSCRLVARGVTSAMPDYTQEQYEGDIIYSDSAIITGTTDDSGLVTNTIELPNTMQLIDGAQYTLYVIPTYDGITGDEISPSWTYTTTEDENAETPVTMEVTTSDYTVDWEHKAAASEDVVVVTDASTLTATITPQAPTGAAEGDLCAIYRVTPNGVYLIADNVTFGSSVIDKWAPYGSGELTYRVATKTDLGDYDWVDVEYGLTGKMLRIDWAANSVLLPYNIAINDSWEKDYEGITYLDGSRSGYWNEGATHSASLSTDIIKVTDAATDRLLRNLAQYTGSVFVRTPNGQAYEGNISVSLDLSYDSAAVAVSLDTEETECITYVCDTSDIAEPVSGE